MELVTSRAGEKERERERERETKLISRDHNNARNEKLETPRHAACAPITECP